MHLDVRLRQAIGPAADHLVFLPPHVYNHHISYRLREGSPSICDLKERIAKAIQQNDIKVRGCSIRAALEQSAQRNAEYSQYASAVEGLKVEDALKNKWVGDGRALRICAATTWQELSRPISWGWRWSASSFAEAGLGTPSLLRSAEYEESNKGEDHKEKEKGEGSADDSKDTMVVHGDGDL